MGEPVTEKVERYVPTPQYDLVETLEIHKADLDRPEYKGDILSLYMREIKNYKLAEEGGILICQYLAMFAHPLNTIYNPYQEGEQAHCFITCDFARSGPKTVVTIRDKRWGRADIECALEVGIALAKRHGWQIVDKRKNLLELIAEAASGD